MSATDARNEARRWMRQAEEDLDTARKLAGLGKHYAACFFSQQAAEKALKSLLFGQGALLVRGHSVAELLSALEERDPELAALRPRAAPLDAYYIPTRYPDGLPGGVPFEAYGPLQSRDALSMAEDVLAVARTRAAAQA